MENTIIKRDDIRSVTTKLGEIADKRKASLSQIKLNVDFLQNITARIYEIIVKLKTKNKEEDKAIDDMHKMIKRINRFDVIDSNKASFDEDILSYVEGQSIISDYNDDVPPLNIEFVKEDLTAIVERINKFIVDGIFEEAKPVHVEERKEIMPVKKAELVCKKIDADGVKIKSNDVMGVISNEIHGKNEEEHLSELILAEKLCEKCQIYSRYCLILSCRCAICINCLKAEMLKENAQILENNYEACNLKHPSMCCCPVHNCSIDIKILEELLGGDTVEKASIEAMKRQKQINALGKKFYQSICKGCNALIEDETNSSECTKLCSKHTICRKCNL